MKKYTTVVFDLDGTLLNTLEDLTDSVNAVMKKNQFPTYGQDAIRGFVGHGIDNLLACVVPGGRKNPDYTKVLEEFKTYYGKHCNDKTAPYEGVLDMLAVLKQRGYFMAIVSNKADFAVKTLNQLYFARYISVAVGAREGREKKPAPDGVFAALSELGASKEESIYIGDSEVDVETAKNSQMDCIAVEWGFRDKNTLLNAGAKEVVSTPDEILEKYLL